MRNIPREITYNWEWQKLRVSLSFSDEEATVASLEKLNEYLLSHTHADTFGNRLTRANNLLNATKMGINGQIERATTLSLEGWIDELKEMRLAILKAQLAMSHLAMEHKAEAAALKTQIPSIQLEDLRKAYREERAIFEKVYRDLHHRFYKGKGANVKTEAQEAKRKADRPELWNYLNMMHKVMLDEADKLRMQREEAGAK